MTGVRIVELDELDVYKVVGDEVTVLDYVEAHVPPSLGDWSGIYFQFSDAHAAGTVGYRWDQGYAVARMHRLRLCDVKVVVLLGDFWCDGAVPGQEKAALARMIIEDACGVYVPPEVPLAMALGEHGMCLAMRETEEEWEVVVSPALLRASLDDEGLVKEYRARYGATSHVRDGEDAPWAPFDHAGHFAMDTPAPGWLAEVLSVP